MSDIKTASVLSFERKLDPSDALLFAGKWDSRKDVPHWVPIGIREKSVRGTISNRLKTKDADPAKLDAKIEVPNLQTVDVATLPNDCDTLKVRFTLRVSSGVGLPSACNNMAYKERLLQVVETYKTMHGFGELAKRYAFNLANGRFLWRNHIGAEHIEIQINHRPDGENSQTWNFNALDFSFRNFNSNNASKNDLDTLAQVIEAGLKGDRRYVLLDVEAYVRVGEGQEVFPSQELILDKSTSKKGQKSKVLYHINHIAAIHSQKIGNALRTIDTWYPDESDLGPIAVEPYGSVTTQGKAYRQPKDKVDFYNLFDKWIIKDQVPDVGNQHYVIAILIRGGVFGESDKE